MEKHQISNIKKQINFKHQVLNSKHILNFENWSLGFIWNLGFRIWFLLLVGTFFFLINPNFTFAQTISYPVKELGNCRDAAECKLYCDVPANTPACWSYGKYVMNVNQVLGDTTVNITYPIAELGNCTSAQECFIYCNQPQNQTTCYDFAKARGFIKEKPKVPENIVELAKKELGCKSDLECMVFCQQPDNIDACRAFGQKYNLIPPPDSQQMGPPPAVMEKAKTELGCDSETSCMQLCNNPQNQEKCFEFAKKNKLVSEDEVKNVEEMRKNKKKMLETAKQELGCDSIESCARICSEGSNREKCYALGRKMGVVKEEFQPQGGSNPESINYNKPQLPCASETECKNYCQAHPDQCPGFPKPSTNAPGTQSMQNFPPPMPPLSPPSFNPNTNFTGNQNFKPSGGSFSPLSGFQQPGQQTNQQTGGPPNPPPPNPSQYPHE